MEENNKNINRRDFLKIVGITSVAQKDRVSLLGYGCMRWPTVPSPDGKGDMIDQDAVNELVDYAIAHGVNYFDTSPVYVQGWSEKSTGIALKRHPREKLFIATKLSNFSNYSRENSIAMYRKSFEDLQTDYIDYYLLHSIGGGGTEAFKARYIDNGMMEFLLKEREAGRIRNLGFSFHGSVDTYDYALSLHDEVKWDFVQIQLNYLDWHNQGAEQLYRELERRNLPVMVMEPVRGGYLATIDSERAKPFFEQELAAIDRVVEEIRKVNEIPCTGCRYCMDCPMGVDIPEIFSIYSQYKIFGKEKAFVQDYEEVVEHGNGAEHCVRCMACTTKCPQMIAIPDKLEMIAKLYTQKKAELEAAEAAK